MMALISMRKLEPLLHNMQKKVWPWQDLNLHQPWQDLNLQYSESKSDTLSIKSHGALPLSFMADEETCEQLLTCFLALRSILQLPNNGI